MSETYATYKVWDGCRAPVNLEYSGRLIGQIVRESTIDRYALLKLADEMTVEKGDIWGWSRRIREACGEVGR